MSTTQPSAQKTIGDRSLSEVAVCLTQSAHYGDLVTVAALARHIVARVRQAQRGRVAPHKPRGAANAL